ncbi:MAG: hypothetical protein GC158_10175 [Cyanobacteria bacterium RI_101]|nr:hypothetical protein [Cyanobacteria bacterium RI_101]
MFRKHPTLGYYISDQGIIMKSRGCGEKKLFCGKSGYLSLTCNGKFYLAHRLVYETFFGEIPDGWQVNHINGVKSDNRLENLEVVTPQENMRHAVATGLKEGSKGEDNSMAKLDNEAYYQIIDEIMSGLSNSAIAKKYGLHPRYVSLIRGKKRLQSLWENYESIHGKNPVPSSGDNSSLSLDNRLSLLADLESIGNAEIAVKYGLDPSTVSKIRSRKQWKNTWEIFEMKVRRSSVGASALKREAALVAGDMT